MSRLIEPRGLLASFRIAPSSVPLDQAPRLLEYVRAERPALEGRVVQHFMSRMPTSTRERRALERFIRGLDERERATPLALALLMDCITHPKGRAVH